MKHRQCGGEVKEDWSKTYPYEDYDEPSLRCQKCNEEVLDNAEILLGDGLDEEYVN